jgi:hypothetical protein
MNSNGLVVEYRTLTLQSDEAKRSPSPITAGVRAPFPPIRSPQPAAPVAFTAAAA